MRRALVRGLWLAIAASLVYIAASGALAEDGPAMGVAISGFFLAFGSTGALVVSRRPRNPIGWILLGAWLAYTIGGLSEVEDGQGPVALEWLSNWVWLAGLGPVATFGLLLFPDGRLPSPGWRPAAWLAGAGLVLVIGGIALEPGPLEGTTLPNPVGLDAVPWLAQAMQTAGLAGFVCSVPVAIVSLLVRYRRARSVERAQLKWLSYAAVLAGVVLACAVVYELIVGSRAEETTNVAVTVSLATLPVAMGIAILRHRLYDIDLVIRRTLVYGGLTATLAAGYLGLVLLIGLALGTSDVAVAASTLAVAALARPARARIQGAVDRRFYRSRYDAALTLQAFGGRLRDEIDLEALGADLRGVVDDAMRPAHVSLWLRGGR